MFNALKNGVSAGKAEVDLYTLSANSKENGAAVIFLFSECGELVPVPGLSGLAMATPEQRISFIAPDGIAGFYLQVQSSWLASDREVVAPYIPDEPTQNGFIDQRLRQIRLAT